MPVQSLVRCFIFITLTLWTAKNPSQRLPRRDILSVSISKGVTHLYYWRHRAASDDPWRCVSSFFSSPFLISRTQKQTVASESMSLSYGAEPMVNKSPWIPSFWEVMTVLTALGIMAAIVWGHPGGYRRVDSSRNRLTRLPGRRAQPMPIVPALCSQ